MPARVRVRNAQRQERGVALLVCLLMLILVMFCLLYTSPSPRDS